jgi:hypothetical protein
MKEEIIDKYFQEKKINTNFKILLKTNILKK